MFERIAVVTGAGRGIGLAVCKALEGECTVVPLDVAFAQAPEGALECDVSSGEQVKAAFDAVAQKYGRLDVLVNNAGISQDSSLELMGEEAWDRVLDVDLKGVFLCSKSAVGIMKKRRYGRIVNIASVIGQMGNRGQANYSAAKAGVIGLTKSLAKELAFYGITVNAIAPGVIDTAMTKKVPENMMAQLVSSIPLRRMGRPEEVAQAVKFLANDASGYITGQVLGVNGGQFM